MSRIEDKREDCDSAHGRSLELYSNRCVAVGRELSSRDSFRKSFAFNRTPKKSRTWFSISLKLHEDERPPCDRHQSREQGSPGDIRAGHRAPSKGNTN